jgi:hypothetical protein
MGSEEEEEEEKDKEAREEKYHDGENIKRFLNARMMSMGMEQDQQQAKSTSKLLDFYSLLPRSLLNLWTLWPPLFWP